MADNMNLNLTCSFCNSPLRVSTCQEGSGYMSYDVPDMIECAGDINCGAEWNPSGELETKPNWILYPELYSR